MYMDLQKDGDKRELRLSNQTVHSVDADVEAHNLSKTVGLLCHRLLSAKVCKTDDLCCPTLLHKLRRAMLFLIAAHRYALCRL